MELLGNFPIRPFDRNREGRAHSCQSSQSSGSYALTSLIQINLMSRPSRDISRRFACTARLSVGRLEGPSSCRERSCCSSPFSFVLFRILLASSRTFSPPNPRNPPSLAAFATCSATEYARWRYSFASSGLAFAASRAATALHSSMARALHTQHVIAPIDELGAFDDAGEAWKTLLAVLHAFQIADLR